MPLTVPPKPTSFAPDVPPPGYRVALIDHNDARPRFVETVRLQLAHTNGASKEGSIESSLRHANQWHPGYVGPDITIPHFQVDRDGDAAMLLELDRRGAAAYKANPFCLSYETADTGYLNDPAVSPFTDEQLQMLANGFAYCSVLHPAITLAYPTVWDGPGSACHTEPFTYPYWTKYKGKICPGQSKKQQVRDIVLPFARVIKAAWVAPPPPVPEEDEMKRYIARLDTNIYHYRVGDGIRAEILRSSEKVALQARFESGFPQGDETGRYFHPWTGGRIEKWTDIPILTEGQLDLDVGYVTEAGKADEG